MSHEDDDTLQRALVETQIAAQASGERIVVVLEGRDAAGKDGLIKRLVEHLSPRSTRVIALPKPSDRERSQWYFQRYVAHLPATGELVIFNRSWYNRAGVEVVNGFSDAVEQAQFLSDVPEFERMLVESGIRLLKFWLDISKEEQARRLEARRSDPLKALKVSPLDAVAQDKWDAYSATRDAMLAATHSVHAPWVCVATDHKKKARRAAIRYLLRAVAPAEWATTVKPPSSKVLFVYEAREAAEKLAP